MLSESEKEGLNWQQYQGTTKEFREERSRILDSKEKVKAEYRGSDGYALYADRFYGGEKQELGNMLKAYQNVSAVLSESEKKALNWQQYQGTTKEFREERSRILDSDRKIKAEYRGSDGYALYADRFYGGKDLGNMQKAYKNVSAVLSESKKKALNWQAYHGTTKEFREERSKILDSKEKVKAEYRGSDGYALYADRFYGGEKQELGDMKKAYLNVSAVLSESEKEGLNWQQYQGTTKEFREERSRILDSKEKVKAEYRGSDGYALYADRFYGGEKQELGNMLKAYQNVSAVLSESEKKALNWQAYFGNTKQFREERSRILDSDRKIKAEYRGSDGYALYADRFYGGEKQELGNMLKAYINVSAVLSESEKEALNWQAYQGTTKQFREERSKILDSKEKVKAEYQGLDGYALYADRFYGGEKQELGNMERAYKNVSAVLSESEKEALNWQQYQGTTKEFREERSRILDSDRKIKVEYRGSDGYALYADRFYGGEKQELGNMKKAYLNVSAVLSESKKKALNWQAYFGNTKEFREERSRILDSDRKIKAEYRGSDGYALYADRFYGGEKQELGNMLRAYLNVSAVLSESEKEALNWQQYQGTTKEFREERSRVLDSKEKVKAEYQGLDGYALYADRFYGGEKQELGNMERAYKNVSAVLSESEKEALNWQQYQGTTKEFREERSRILDSDRKIKVEYRGSDGYALYADRFYGGEKQELGNMLRAYKNVSAVLSKEDMKDLGWKVFYGNTYQFHTLSEFLKIIVLEDYQGPNGQKKISKMIFKNHLSNTYVNISALRDYLFNNKDEFKDLRKSGWSRTLSW